MKDWNRMLEDMLRDACAQELPYTTEEADSEVFESITECSYYREAPQKLIEELRDQWWPRLEPRVRKTIEQQRISPSVSAKDFVAESLPAVCATSIGTVVYDFAGFVGGACVGAGITYLLHNHLNTAHSSPLSSKDVTLTVKAIKELPLPCWREAITQAREKYLQGREECTALLEEAMEDVFGSKLTAKKLWLPRVISEVTQCYTAAQKAASLEQNLGKDLTEAFDACLKTQYVNNVLSPRTRLIHGITSTVMAIATGTKTNSLELGVISGSFCLLLSYSLHKAITCRHRSSAEQEYLRACFFQVKTETHLSIFKKIVSKYRPYLEKQGIHADLAMLFDEDST